MNNKVQIFNFENDQVRVIEIEGEPWFVAKDVAEILGYKKPENAVATHVDTEDKTTTLIQGTGSNYKSKAVTINESGLYSLVLSSKLPAAKKFKRWVTSEVLPSIRKHGAYATPQTIESILANPDYGIKLLQALKEERSKKEQALQEASKEREGRLIAEQRVNEMTPKVSYYDLVLKNKSLVTITQIAKDYGMSGKAMNDKLHELKVQYKQGSIWLLYSEYQQNGWTQSQTKMVGHNKEKAVMYTKWTQKGRLGLYELLKENGVLPLIEREDN